MKRIITKFLLLFSMLMTIMGCSKNDNTEANTPIPDGKGALKIEIGEINEFKSTTTVFGKVINTDDFRVVIVNAKGDIVEYYEKYSEMPGLLYIEPGNGYKVRVSNIPEMESITEENLYIYGESDFNIVNGELSAIKVTAIIKNVVVSLSVGDDFKAKYGTDFYAVVRNEDWMKDGDPQVIIDGTDPTKAAFLKPAPYYVTVYAPRNSINPITKRVDEVSGTEHHIISLTVTKVGIFDFSLSLDKSVITSEVINKTPTLEDELDKGGVVVPPTPGEEDDLIKFMPIIKGQSFDIAKPLVLSTERDFIKLNTVDKLCKVPVKIDVKAGYGIANLFVTINSPEIPAAYTNALFGGATFDLANLNKRPNPDNPIEMIDVKQNLILLGLLKESDVIKNIQFYTFDLTKFMSLLGEIDDYHKFDVKLIDNKGNEKVSTLTIKREK